MTGSEGRKHTQRMLKSGTAIAGGVTPGKGGQVVEFDASGCLFNPSLRLSKPSGPM